MIRIAVELHPGGNPAQQALIADLEIANRNGLAQICDYDYRFGEPDISGDPLLSRWSPWFLVHDHRRADGVWALVAQVLARHAAGNEEWSDYNELGSR